MLRFAFRLRRELRPFDGLRSPSLWGLRMSPPSTPFDSDANFARLDPFVLPAVGYLRRPAKVASRTHTLVTSRRRSGRCPPHGICWKSSVTYASPCDSDAAQHATAPLLFGNSARHQFQSREGMNKIPTRMGNKIPFCVTEKNRPGVPKATDKGGCESPAPGTNRAPL